ncbi:hypothetical protein BH11MYX4_BH11MYX4_57460 [soil metagenome]
MKYAALSLVLVTSFALVGCDKIQEKVAQKAAEKAVESASGGSVAVTNGTSGGVTVTDPSTGATAVSGAAVKLPAGWPANVPIYPGAAIRNALTSPSGKTVTLATKDTSAKFADCYKTKSGLKLENDMDLGQQHMLMFKNGKGSVVVTLGQAGPDTMVTIAVVD